MNRNKIFLKNTVVIFIGKLLTQFMSLLLIPLYTHFLDTSDYGYIDLVQTYVLLLVPLGCLRIDTAVFRFLIDNRKDDSKKAKIIFNSVLVMLLGCLIIIVIGIVINYIFRIKYFFDIIINLIILTISSLLLQILRGVGNNKKYSISSIIVGFLTLFFNIIFIMILKKGAISIIYSSNIANLIGIIYIFFTIRKMISINKKNYDKLLIKDMAKYSLPMIPDYLSGWIINVSDRTIITAFLGNSMNGMYSVSCKFSNILNSIYNIYNISWQENVVLHFKDEDRDSYFTRLFNDSLSIFSSMGLFVLIFLPVGFNIIIGAKYADSYNYIPILLYANIWRVIVGLTMGFYVANKKTKEVAATTCISAVINIIINFVLINFIGIYAACISTLFSYFIMAIYRYRDCKKFIKIKLDIKMMISYTIMYAISSLCFYSNSLFIYLIDILVMSIMMLLFNRKIITKIINKMKKSKKNKRL